MIAISALIFLLSQNLKGKGKGKISTMILKDHPLIVRLSPIQGRPYGNECKSREVRAEGSSCEQEGAQKQVECLPPAGVKYPKKMLGHGHQDPCILGAIGDREGLCTNELPCGGERNMHSGVGLNSGRAGVLGWEL